EADIIKGLKMMNLRAYVMLKRIQKQTFLHYKLHFTEK
ncbi:MAG: hypothetical protein ACJAUP_003279, partial [Cellvibrionaceae bacterium]